MTVPIRRIYASTLVLVSFLAALLAGVLTAPAPGQAAQEISPEFDNSAWFTLLPVKASICGDYACWLEDTSVTLTVTPARSNVLGNFCESGTWVGMGTMGDGQSSAGQTTYGGPYPQCIPVVQEDGQTQFVTTNAASNYGETVYGFKAGVGYKEGDTIPNPSSVGEWWSWVANNMVGGTNLIQALGPVVSPTNLTNNTDGTNLPQNINGIFFVDLAVTKSGYEQYQCGSLAVMMQQSTEKNSVRQNWAGLWEDTAISLGKDIGVSIVTGNPLGIFIGIAMFFGHVIADLIDSGTTLTESSTFWVQPYTTLDTSFGVPYWVPGKVVQENPGLDVAGSVLIPCGDGTEVWLGITEGSGEAGGTFDVVYLDKSTIDALNLPAPGPCGAVTNFSYCDSDSCTGCTQALYQYLWADHYTVTCDSCTEDNGGQGPQTSVHCRDPNDIVNSNGELTCQ